MATEDTKPAAKDTKKKKKAKKSKKGGAPKMFFDPSMLGVQQPGAFMPFWGAGMGMIPFAPSFGLV